MGKGKDVGGLDSAVKTNEKELLEKIAKMEETLEDIQRDKKKRDLVGIVGFLLVLAALLIFLSNFFGFAKNKMHDPRFHKELLSSVSGDLKDISENSPNFKLIMRDLRDEILPSLYKQVLARLKKETPKIKGAGKKMASDIKVYLKKDVKNKLINALSESLTDVETVLHKKYPKISVHDLHKVISSAQSTFILEVTGMLDKKLAYVSDDLGSLKASVDQFKQCEEYGSLDPNDEQTLHEVKTQMVESMLELVIYHLNEKKGAELVDASGIAKGGVK